MNDEPSVILARIDRVRAQLDEARTLADVGAVLDAAERLRRYAKVAEWTLEQQNAIGRVWFMAQRRGGEVLKALEVRAGNPQLSKNGTIAPRLPEVGVTRNQSMFWQRYARVPEDRFLAILDEIAQVRRLTTSALLPYLEGERAARPVVLGETDAGQAVVYESHWQALLDEIDDESVDLLLTDPPYMTEVDDVAAFARAWAPAAVRTVRRSGRAFICIGAYPDELHAYLDVLRAGTHLRLDQVLVWTYRNTLGPAPTHTYKQNWQAILSLSGRAAAPLDCPSMVEQFSVFDIPAPDGRHGTRVHAWQKPDALADRLVRHALPEGGVLLDPFAGTGAFLAAAARAGGRGIGSEIDADMLGVCERRRIEVVHASSSRQQ